MALWHRLGPHVRPLIPPLGRIEPARVEADPARLAARSIYPLLNYLFPHRGTLIAEMIWTTEGPSSEVEATSHDEEKSVGKDDDLLQAGVLPVAELR